MESHTKQTDTQIDTQTDGQSQGNTNGHTHRWTELQTHGWMGTRMDIDINGRIEPLLIL